MFVRSRAGKEVSLKLGIGQPERDVHPRPVGLVDRVEVEIRAVNVVVQQPCLCDVALLGSGETAVLQQPLENQTGDVDRERRRRVVQRPRLGMSRIVQHRRRCWLTDSDEVVANDHQGQSGGSDVLLCAGVDQA